MVGFMSGVRLGTSLAVDEECAPRSFKEDGRWLKTGSTLGVMKNGTSPITFLVRHN